MMQSNIFGPSIYCITTILNAIIGYFYGRKLERDIIVDVREGSRKGVVRGLKTGVLCGLWIGLITGTSIFPIIGTVLGIIIGLILGVIFGKIADAIFTPIIKKKMKAGVVT
ncbi:MAG: hypothetical protein HY920_01175 [Elusimicrobia bacterium]|nr:hypothetical protein [Elusimicrobiota bacterium]